MTSRPLRSEKGKVVATFSNGTVYKRVSGKEHQLQSPPAWTYDIVVLEQADKFGADLLVIDDNDNDFRYSISVESFRRNGFLLDRGHGLQMACTIHRWRVDRVTPAYRDKDGNEWYFPEQRRLVNRSGHGTA
jgi:hypothetical protein